MTLDELIRDRAAKGELSHISVVFSQISGKWHAIYAPTHIAGFTNAEGNDPVDTLVKAITAPKTSRKRVTVAVTKEAPEPRMTNGDPVAAVTKPGKIAIEGWE